MGRIVFGRYDCQDKYHIFHQSDEGVVDHRKCQHGGSQQVNSDVEDNLTLAEREDLEKFFDICPSCDGNYDLQLRMSDQEIRNEVFDIVGVPHDADTRHARVWSKILRELRQ